MIYKIKRFDDSSPRPIMVDLKLVERRLYESGLSKRETDIILDGLRGCDEPEEIMKWAKTGKVEDPKILKVMEKTGLSFPAAYIESEERVFSTSGSKVWLMFGIPGSGKSTWIKKNKPNLPVVSRDLIREKFGIQGKYKGSSMFEYEVNLEHKRQTDKLLKEGKEFIIDDTNLSSYTSSLFRYLRLNGASEIIGVVMKTPLNVCIERRPEIPEQVLRSMNNKYMETFPWLKELDKIIWIKH